jgi:Txe/YoeB family toxin of Txe-Axe toxin-antitoxin module
MSKFKLDNRTLQLLNAQVNLSETFNHTLRSTPKREALAFRLKVERSTSDTLFVIELGSERHTLTLQNERKMHLKLADFIEEIANGPFDASNTVDLLNIPHSDRQYARFDIEHKQRVFELVRTGGVVSLDMGFELPLHVAIHRTKTRIGVTTIMSIGVKSPRTKCFTVCGSDVEIYEKVVESINHLAAVATPAAHAA